MPFLSGIVKSLLRSTVITPPASGTHKGSVLFLHGTCDSGKGLRDWITQVLPHDFKFKDYRVLYPSSPVRPYKLMGGQNAPVWYDRLSLGPDQPEDILSINKVADEVITLVNAEKGALGATNKAKVIVGGFAMGGSLALHLGYRMSPEVAGVFALSSFLPPDSTVFSSLDGFTKKYPQVEPDELSRRVTGKDGRLLDKPASRISEKRLPKLFMSHGGADPIVKSRWSKETFKAIRNYGVEGYLHSVPNLSHEISAPQLQLLHGWIEETLSDTPKPRIEQTKPYHINDEMAIPFPYYDWHGK